MIVRRGRRASSLEGRGGVLAEAGGEEVTSPRVVVDEGRDVVNEAGDDDELASLRCGLDCDEYHLSA